MASTPLTHQAGRRRRSPIRIVSNTADEQFQHFYEDEWRSVLGLALVLSGDKAAAEDLAQEAFAAAYRDWHRVSDYDKPGAFVRRVVANKAVSRRRRLTNEHRLLARLAGRRRETGLPPDLDESWALVRRLPSRQAQVFALFYMDDLPLSEVALLLGITTETAKTHLSRARAALARHVPGGSDTTSASPNEEELT